MARWEAMVSVMVIGLVLSKSILVAGERCTLDQHHEMQVSLSINCCSGGPGFEMRKNCCNSLLTTCIKL